MDHITTAPKASIIVEKHLHPVGAYGRGKSKTAYYWMEGSIKSRDDTGKIILLISRADQDCQIIELDEAVLRDLIHIIQQDRAGDYPLSITTED